MRTDSSLRYEAMSVLLRTLGQEDAERFIGMIKNDTVDCTEWRRGLWNDTEEIHGKATAHERSSHRPNAETEEAMRECEEMLASGNYKRYSSTKEMFADILEGDDGDEDDYEYTSA